MTYEANDEKAGGCLVVPELKLSVGGDIGDDDDYVKLRDSDEDDCCDDCGSQHDSSTRCMNRCWGFCWWAKIVVLLIFVASLAAVFLIWVGPFFMDKEIIPFIKWERSTFSTSVLGIILFASIALFPTILLPSTPSMWAAGMTFGYGYGFLLILGGASIGVSLPYFIGSLFYGKIQGWLEKYSKKASLIRLAGEGDWFNQFRAVALIRISPFPYIIYNYCAIATHVKYTPFLVGSLVGMVPEILVAIYTGTLIRALADASQEHSTLTAPQIVFNILGFCGSVLTTIVITKYAKRRIKELEDNEALLPQ